MRKSIIFLGLLLSGALTVFAAADYSLQIGNVTWIGGASGYNSFSATAYPNTVNFTITKLASGNKSYAVTAGPAANSGTYNRRLASGANTLNYQFYTSSALANVLEAPPTANASQVLSG